MNYKVQLQKVRLQLALSSLDIIGHCENMISAGTDVEYHKSILDEHVAKYAQTLSDLFEQVTGDVQLDVTEIFYHEHAGKSI